MYRSHIGQDKWVAQVFNNSNDGYFLDFGAFDGISISNTYYLEKILRWNGICVEPNFTFFPELCKNRNVITLNYALWGESRIKLAFQDAHGLSSIVGIEHDDHTSELRNVHTKGIISVNSYNPNELMKEFAVPEFIHYLSLDVEGAEINILQSMNLGYYKFGLMTIEHNHFKNKRDAVREFLKDLSYDYVEVKNEDWFYSIANLEKLSGYSSKLDPGDLAKKIDSSYGINE
jgi:FkbM family methyltransferase